MRDPGSPLRPVQREPPFLCLSAVSTWAVSKWFSYGLWQRVWFLSHFHVGNLAWPPLGWWQLFHRNAVEPPEDGVPVKANVAAEWQTGDRILRSRPTFPIDPGDFYLQPFRDFFGRENLQSFLGRSCRRGGSFSRIRGACLTVHPHIEVVNVDEAGVGDGGDADIAGTDEFFNEPRGRRYIRSGVIHRKQSRCNGAGNGNSISQGG